MSLWILLFAVFAAGSLGGVVNALLSDNGFVKPQTDEHGGRKIVRPGVLGNILVGGVAAVVSWGLYGPLAGVYIMGGPQQASAPVPGLTLAAMVGAALVGVAGARWLTNEVDKSLLRAAASEAISASPRRQAASKILTETPAGAWRIAAEEAKIGDTLEKGS